MLLNERIEQIDDYTYKKVMEKFKDLDWREFFFLICQCIEGKFRLLDFSNSNV